MTEHQITIDSEVFAEIKTRARPFEDHTPNQVLRRLVGLDAGETATTSAAPPTNDRPRRGKLLPSFEYELPVLQYLADHGGHAPTREVIKAVGDALADKLTELDHQHLQSGRVRWENRVQFVRLRLAERGELVKDSPHGVWELTAKGAARVRGESI